MDAMPELTKPSRPEDTASWTTWLEVSNLCWLMTVTRRSLSRSAAATRCAASKEMSSGFSTTTCLLAFSAATAMSACWPLGVQRATASMSGRDRASNRSVSARAWWRSASACACSSWTSTTTPTSACGRSAMVWACRSPIVPAPTTANFICFRTSSGVSNSWVHRINRAHQALVDPSTVGDPVLVQQLGERSGRVGEQVRAAEAAHRARRCEVGLHREEPFKPVGFHREQGLRQLPISLAGRDDLSGGHHGVLDMDVLEVRTQQGVTVGEGSHPALDEVGRIPDQAQLLRAD